MLAVIGGTGLYKLEGVETLEVMEGDTPFGSPSASVRKLRFGEREFLFLPRHGEHHQFLPHEINYRANIFALKQSGAREVIGFSAVGSLREQLSPGNFVIPDQYIDFVKGNRERSFFGGGIAAHVSTATPTCPLLVSNIVKAADQGNFTLHPSATYICVDGPRLGTRAESHFFRQIGCDVVGMTNVPEVFLAREAQLPYATVGIVTDYDCWMKDPAHHVQVSEVIARYGKSLMNAQTLLKNLLNLKDSTASEESPARTALAMALLTSPDSIPEDKRAMLEILKA